MFQLDHVTRGLVTLEESDGVCALAAAGDRRFLVGSVSGAVELWDAARHEADSEACAVRMEEKPVISCMLGVRSVTVGGEKGNLGACTSLDGELSCFRLPLADAHAAGEHEQQVKVVASLPAESMAVAMCSRADYIVAVGGHGTVRIVDGTTGMVVETSKLEPSTGAAAQVRSDSAKERRKAPPTALAVDIDSVNEKALIGVDDGSLALVDIKTAQVEHTERECHRDAVRCIAYAKHSPSEVITSGNDQLISMYDVRTRSVVATVRGHTGPVTCASFSHSGTYFTTGATDRTVRVWDRRKMEMIFRSRAHQDSVLDVQYLSDGVGLVSCSEDGTMAVHDYTGA